LLSLVTEIELSLGRNDAALLVMPMCHANSLYFFGSFTYCGGTCSIYSRKSFDPEHLVRTLARDGATFTSLVPTHYIMMLGLSASVRRSGQQADDLVGAGPSGHETGDHGALQELRPVRALWIDGSRLGDDAASGRAVHQARLRRP
jgi:hypothetical protein